MAQSFFTPESARRFDCGEDRDAYRRFGAHPCRENGAPGTHFALWAPNARAVTVRLGEAEPFAYADMSRTVDGVWECFVPSVGEGTVYHYLIVGADGIPRIKADPFARYAQRRPKTGSIVCAEGRYVWGDGDYLSKHSAGTAVQEPMAIYEVHLGSWKKDYSVDTEDGFLNYRRLADELAEYVEFLGFTHVELIGICEHPLDMSWGYQVTGYYAPTSRYGTPDDLRCFVDTMHRRGIGVILDWVPAHFPKDSFGLEMLDGTALYEHPDPLRGEYPEWGTKAFDHGKGGVCSFLISNALYWVREFHMDAIRVDAVASMLYSSFGRAEWRPNIYGGAENLESTAFLKAVNRALREESRAYMIAEDSSILPGVTDPVEKGGLGFLFKWSMGWMNDTLKYVRLDPVFRGWEHDLITHIPDYSFNENYVLVLSHDEVVHLKHSMLEKFPGSLQDKLGGLKTLYTYMMTMPGKKLLFMGQEFAEDREWIEDRDIQWGLTKDPGHRDVMLSLRELLKLYRASAVLYSDSRCPSTFEWVNKSDAMRSTFSYIRRNPWNYEDALLVVCNFSPVAYDHYAFGVPCAGWYERVFSTYDQLDGRESVPPLTAEKLPSDGYPFRLTYHLRPYESVIFRFPKKK